MAGIIGLTPAGQAIDKYVFEHTVRIREKASAKKAAAVVVHPPTEADAVADVAADKAPVVAGNVQPPASTPAPHVNSIRGVVKFIQNFTVKITGIRHSLRKDKNPHIEFIMDCVQRSYNDMLKTTFEGKIDDYLYSLLRNYINTLTKPDFMPTTKTQRGLIRRRYCYILDRYCLDT